MRLLSLFRWCVPFHNLRAIYIAPSGGCVILVVVVVEGGTGGDDGYHSVFHLSDLLALSCLLVMDSEELVSIRIL